MADSDKPLRFRVLIEDLSKGAGAEQREIVHQANIACANHAELATYLRKTATLVDKHGD